MGGRAVAKNDPHCLNSIRLATYPECSGPDAKVFFSSVGSSSDSGRALNDLD
jgi:hypothetical protein